MIKINKLTKTLAEKYKSEIFELLKLIPEVEYNVEDILKEEKTGRILYGKWDHSLIAFTVKKNKPVAILIGYERQAEDNNHYPVNSLYLNEICVDPDFQGKGIAKALIKEFLKHNFIYLKGKQTFAVQTNAADWNKKVQKLYLSFGFIKTGEKQYPNRTDNIYFLNKN